MENTKDTFIKGAALLTLATFISKVLGAVYRVPYQNITGDVGMYVFQQVYPLYNVLLILATTGFPMAISKVVSDHLAKGNQKMVYQIYRISTYLLIGFGGGMFLLLFFGAGTIAKWMGNEKMLTFPIQAVSWALLVIPLTAIFRGIFQGYQQMEPTAISQVSEQMIRVATIIFSAWYCMELGLGVIYAGAGATFGAVTGAIGGLVVLLYFRKKSQMNWTLSQKRESVQSLTVIKQLCVIALPICLGSLTIPLYALIDSFTVANLLLKISHFTLQDAILLKGVYDRGQPLIQFAAFFSTALSLSLVPAIAAKKIQRNTKQIRQLVSISLRLTCMLGIPASIGLALIMKPTNVMLFQNGDGSMALSILALGAFFLTLSITASGILQGMGRIYLPTIYLIIGILIKIVGNHFFIPLMEIRGAAIASVLAYGVHACLTLYALKRMISFSICFESVKKYFYVLSGMIIVTLTTMYVLEWVVSGFPLRVGMAIVSLGATLTGGLSYSLLLFRFALLSREDLTAVPKLQKKVLPILEKWKFIR